MIKYNKSEIMKRAWASYKAGKRWNGANRTFAECLKTEWAIAKKNVLIAEEQEKYYNEICMKFVKQGEDAVDDAYRAYRNSNTDEGKMFTAHMRAWKQAVKMFREVKLTIDTVLVNPVLLV